MVSAEDLKPDSCHVNFTRGISSVKSQRQIGRSMRTIRSVLFHPDRSSTLGGERSVYVSENLTDSVVDMRLGELANRTRKGLKLADGDRDEFLELSQAFSDYSGCSSDISGELQRLASLPSPEAAERSKDDSGCSDLATDVEPCAGFLHRESFSTEIIESISPEDLQPTVKLCVDGLQSASVTVKRAAAAKLRLLAKNRTDNRALIGESGAVPALVPLLRSSDPWTQEHGVTALLNLSLHEGNKKLLVEAGAVKAFVYVLKTGTETSKQNAACALLSLSLIEENKTSIGACGAIAPLVSLLLTGSNRGKKDALTTLYKLCSIKQNKERAVSAGAIKPLVEMILERGMGMSEKAMVVLSSLAGVKEGREAIVIEGGIPVLVEAIEDGSAKGKEFAVLTLLQLCSDNVMNRGLLVREGGIPPLVGLSQSGTIRAKSKVKYTSEFL